MAGFVLLPAFGLRATTWAGVALNLARGRRRVALARRTASRRPRRHPADEAPLATHGRPGAGGPAPSAVRDRGRPWIAATRARRVGLRLADPAGRLVAAAGADSRPDHLRLQPGRGGLHRRPRAWARSPAGGSRPGSTQPAAGPGGRLVGGPAAPARRPRRRWTRACWPWPRAVAAPDATFDVGAAAAGAARRRLAGAAGHRARLRVPVRGEGRHRRGRLAGRRPRPHLRREHHRRDRRDRWPPASSSSPALGLYDSLRALGIGGGAGSPGTGLAGRPDRRRAPVAARRPRAALAAVAAATLPPWSPALLSSGAYKYASTMTGDALDISLLAGRLLYYRDGAMARSPCARPRARRRWPSTARSTPRMPATC